VLALKSITMPNASNDATQKNNTEVAQRIVIYDLRFTIYAAALNSRRREAFSDLRVPNAQTRES